MTPNIRSEILVQVARVRRRLFVSELLQTSVVAIFVALLAGIAWLLVEPFVTESVQTGVRWTLLGSALGVGLIGAIVAAAMRRPNSTNAALWLDQAFNLRERTVTSLSLSEHEAKTPAGEALLADALARVRGLKVGERFPLTIGRRGWLVPAAAGALALVALFYDPVVPTAQGVTEDKKLAAADKAELEKRLAEISRPKRDQVAQPEKGKSEALKQLEAKLEEIAKKPRETTQQLRERVKDITPLEDQIKKLERERAEKSRMVQQQLQAKDSITPNDAPKDGPTAGFQQALSEGDLDKARDELDKLSKKMQAGEMTDQDKDKLAKEMGGLQKKLQDMAKQQSKEDMLKKLADEGKLDPEALERELQELQKDNQKLKDLQKLADKMGQCQKSMKAGDMAGAKKAMAESMDQLEQMSRDSDELSEMREQLSKLKQTKDALTSACDSKCPGAMSGDSDGDDPGSGSSMNRGQGGGGDNAKNAAQGYGQRPEGDQGKIRNYDAKQNGQFNAKGQKVFDGFVPGQAFKKKTGVELAGEIRQAAQDAPEAIESQRIPKAARDMARGYFKNLGGQAEPEKKKDSQPEKKPEEKK